MRARVRFSTYGIMWNLGAFLILRLGMLNCSTTKNAEVGLIHSSERSGHSGNVFDQSWRPWEASPGILHATSLYSTPPP